MKRVTMADVAERANVSKSTVSQFLNQRYEFMGVKTKQRIEKAIEELGYQPNMVARSLKQKSSTTIGVIVANISHEFSTRIIQVIEHSLHQLNYHVIVCNAEDNPEKEKKYIDMLLAKQVDGLIIFPTSTNVNVYNELNVQDFPLVFIDRFVPEVEVPTIMLDNKQALCLAVEELNRNGYKRVGILTNSTIFNVAPRVERIEGFKQACRKFGLPIEENFIRGVETGKMTETLKDIFQSHEPPEALVAGNDLVLMEILKYARDHRLRIPQDLAIIAVDDVSFSSIYNPAITTIAQPIEKMGEKASEILIEKIIGKKNAEKDIIRFPAALVSRSSC
ncbi:LacI family DNA-binding transcriptional regulator [Salimicrobium humidisoli]|uniref:LacI family transcriptional regulator n=1 Tax=Salimicrobium humidisoli TaxID=2029857 RepID=A0ABX4HTD2_9BACI|nr:substrate-binding domain-containing protein [Salimicrobium humidisoli]PBB06487.1 LacI family transcriptional regulator [Salimicrobium humidisoli]